ncbi:hypothetical protein [Armatimonas sp.]|uniref:hypothetical protein n=1 Tax=Armatimonas sp. TaxID=1872638 RepID=UPI00374CE7E3
MIKPGSKDKKVSILITGDELTALQNQDMPESFGLEDRIQNYKGIRPIGLYRWDLEFLIETIEFALESKNPHTLAAEGDRDALLSLRPRLQEIYDTHYS